MSRRAASVIFVACVLGPGLVASAQAQDTRDRISFDVTSASLLPMGQPIRLLDTARVPAPQVPVVQPFRRIDRGDSPLMVSLYVATGLTQALDVHSTITALDRGGVETNPLLSGIAGNKPAFIAVKGAVAFGSVMAARKLARKNKAAAVITLVAMNAAYGWIAHHNYKVASRLR